MTHHRAPLAALAAAVLLAGCHDHPAHTRPIQPGIDRQPVVTQVAGCDQLETAIEDAVVAAMRAELESLRASWATWNAAPAPGAAAGTSGPGSYSTTNAQVAGVAEADFVQNDGTRIATLADGALHLLRSWPADALAEAAALPIEGWPREMFLSGDQATVFSAIYERREGFFDEAYPLCPVTAGAFWYCGYWGNDATKITLVDVAALDAPRVTAELFLPGSYLSSRRIGDRVRVVLSDRLPYPDGVRFWPEGLDWAASPPVRDAAFDALEAANERLIRAPTLDDWLRRWTVRRADGSSATVGYACEDFAVSSGPTRPGILTIATIDLARQDVVSRTSLLAHADTVYASRDTLYVAASHWWWWPAPGEHDATYLHAFDLRDPDRAPYLGSGVVDGTFWSQYDLDEHEGRLRVASTVHTWSHAMQEWEMPQQASQIAVLALDGGALREVGRTAPFGAGETLFGARFVGTRGFAITARRIDPLFTFDLSDPANPVKVGEVEMPGYIGYLHPIDATHLLGIGQEGAGAGGPMRVKVQLLDVTDLARPVAGTPTLVGEGWSWSEALWNPKAFTYLPATGVLAIPFADWSYPRSVSDLRLFQVDPAAGITPLGSLSMGDVYVSTAWDASWSPWVRRGILADGFVYAVTDAGVRSASVAQLPAWLATVPFAPAAR